MMYAGSKNKLVQTAELTKVMSPVDGAVDGFLQRTKRAKQPGTAVSSCSCTIMQPISKALCLLAGKSSSEL
jgi:hypothetical protein